MSTYLPPVSRFLSMGELDYEDEWPDYVANLGLQADHVPELIRMARDESLYRSKAEDGWATVYARRAIGQLRAKEAVDPLLAAMDLFGDDDDFWLEEMPEILAMIGPSAIPAIAHRLGENRPDLNTRVMCSSALAQIGNTYTEARAECVAILAKQLQRKEDEKDSWSLNGFIVSALLELEAVEAAPVIEDAFSAGVVDESIAGGWETARYELGLGPKPKGHDISPQWRIPFDPGSIFPRPEKRPNLEKLRKKQKAQKKARKRQR